MGEASGGITIYNISAQVRGWNCMVFSTLIIGLIFLTNKTSQQMITILQHILLIKGDSLVECVWFFG